MGRTYSTASRLRERERERGDEGLVGMPNPNLSVFNGLVSHVFKRIQKQSSERTSEQTPIRHSLGTGA